MSNKLLFMITIFAAIICTQNFVGAEPVVTGVSGIISHGQSITITGSNFGTGPSIYKWDNFEGATHTVDEDVGAGPGSIAWNPYPGSNKCKISDDANRTGSTQHARSTFVYGGHWRGSIYMDYDGATPSPVYVTWWWRWDENAGSSSDNWKPFWPVGYGQTPEAPRVSHCFLGDANNGPYSVSSESGYESTLYKDAPTEGDWVRFEFFGIESSGGSAEDGTIIWLGQQSAGAAFTTFFNLNGNVRTRVSDHWNRTYFGDYAHLDSGLDLDIDFDDTYIANSRARVEIGDNSAWAKCKHREIHIPTVWKEDSITITVNQGSFATCEQLYLFVVDANGNVNTQGYPIRIVTGAGEAPCPPTGLLVK